ncbi:MAG: hypothetical protein U1B78_06285 [Dehalococcoidia bacterium]|nr:hypothetical protein [Dehalococcoidia bacterium]
MSDAIPPGELAGLHAFQVRVGASAGQRYPERPQWVEIEGSRDEVASVDNEWREEDRLGYRVTLRDGRRMLLYYVPNEDLWSGVVLT